MPVDDFIPSFTYLTDPPQLGSNLGCVLFQFGKSFKQTPVTLQRLGDLGAYLKTQCPGGRFAIEFRHPSWFDEQGCVRVRVCADLNKVHARACG